jgi:hypothetical protein
MSENAFPIQSLLPAIRGSLQDHPRLVLEAPPGAGKTTQVPLALLDADWLRGQKIVMLEPRRVAARAAAGFMAKQFGEAVGETVGYRIRFENKVGPNTRIEVVTEGILTRMLQDDPMLEGVGALLFDEFHERHLAGDLGLALALDVQSGLRDDLRIVVMSATLDGERLATFLDAPRLSSAGRSYPVEIAHFPARREEAIEHQTKRAIEQALTDASRRRAGVPARAARDRERGAAPRGCASCGWGIAFPSVGASCPDSRARPPWRARRNTPATDIAACRRRRAALARRTAVRTTDPRAATRHRWPASRGAGDQCRGIVGDLARRARGDRQRSRPRAALRSQQRLRAAGRGVDLAGFRRPACGSRGSRRRGLRVSAVAAVATAGAAAAAGDRPGRAGLARARTRGLGQRCLALRRSATDRRTGRGARLAATARRARCEARDHRPRPSDAGPGHASATGGDAARIERALAHRAGLRLGRIDRSAGSAAQSQRCAR